MRSFWSILPVILIGLCGCKSDIDQFGEYVVTLKNEPYPLTFPAYGISNIFFDSILNYQFVFPDKCEHMQVAALTNLEGKRPVYIARMMIDDSTIYSVDVNNDFNFRNDTFLVFDKRIGAVPVASVSLNIPRQDLTLQILLDLPWIYARVANYKTGFIHLMDQTYRVELHSRSRLTPYHEIMIDFDQNDSIFKQSVVSGDEVFISEMVDPRYPFYLAGKRLLLDKKSDFELTFKETED
ncbi:MAG: hypothetical protein KDC53_15135, partial [Saprospiraceae bacterium]|nr:hypothetical protein [Saprospiraceae bacterium]